jgi:hypothetical protein
MGTFLLRFCSAVAFSILRHLLKMTVELRIVGARQLNAAFHRTESKKSEADQAEDGLECADRSRPSALIKRQCLGNLCITHIGVAVDLGESLSIRIDHLKARF